MNEITIGDRVRVRDGFVLDAQAHEQLRQHIAARDVGEVIAYAGDMMNAIGAYGVFVNFSGVPGNDWYFEPANLDREAAP